MDVTNQLVLDAGALIALLDKDDNWHEWAKLHIKEARLPTLTCEAVISESFHILEKVAGGQEALAEVLKRKLVIPEFTLRNELEFVLGLMDQYANLPMSLADACLVRMSELHPRARILTLDSDFKIYRRHSNRPVPAIIP